MSSAPAGWSASACRVSLPAKLSDLGGEMRALLYTTGSPFARAVRIILDELELDYERREEITTPTVEQRAADTPSLQVPTFWDGSIHLWESGLIADYLLRTYPKRVGSPPLSASAWRAEQEWRDKLIFSTIQTLGTAVTMVSQFKWPGIEKNANAHLTRCADRVPHLLSWLEGELSDDASGFIQGCVSVQDIFLACHIRFTENRPIGIDLDLPGYPRISAVLGRLEERESFSNNPIYWWEPGVTGYESDGTPVYGAS